MIKPGINTRVSIPCHVASATSDSIVQFDPAVWTYPDSGLKSFRVQCFEKALYSHGSRRSQKDDG